MGKMKDSSLLKWTQNNKNNKLTGSSEKKEKKNGKTKDEKKKNWLHTPENLTSGHIAYLVKFLGSTEVDQPKGIEVVKEGIRKLKFAQQIKKAEGTKTPKEEDEEKHTCFVFVSDKLAEEITLTIGQAFDL